VVRARAVLERDEAARDDARRIRDPTAAVELDREAGEDRLARVRRDGPERVRVDEDQVARP
jgi:hypothetical protein